MQDAQVLNLECVTYCLKYLSTSLLSTTRRIQAVATCVAKVRTPRGVQDTAVWPRLASPSLVECAIRPQPVLPNHLDFE